MNKQLSKLKDKFLDYLKKEKSYKKQTVQNYQLYLERFISFIDSIKTNQITEDVISKYKTWLNNFRDDRGEYLETNTKNYHLIALRSFFSHLSDNDYKVISPNKIKLFKNKSKKITIITQDELEQIFAKIEEGKKNKNKKLLSYRDKSIFKLILSTGIKVSKIEKIKKDNFKNSQIEIKSGCVEIDNDAKQGLQKYLSLRSDNNPYLIISHDKRTKGNTKPLSSRSIQRIIKKYVRKAGLNKKITPSVLRHTYAKKLIDKNKKISEIQDKLNHSSIYSTKLYINQLKNCKK